MKIKQVKKSRTRAKSGYSWRQTQKSKINIPIEKQPETRIS